LTQCQYLNRRLENHSSAQTKGVCAARWTVEHITAGAEETKLYFIGKVRSAERTFVNAETACRFDA
jgi:hypothetical protein